jgi:guanylate kinase
MSKLLLFAAPSGAGKTTIVHHLLDKYDELSFSVSATTRGRRPHEIEGKDYYFLSSDRFQALIRQNAFLEWEEVYEGLFYGTLRSELQRLWSAGKYIVFDIDVKGALNIKQAYPEETTAIFVKPPSLEALSDRLRRRGTEDDSNLEKRMDRAAAELAYEPQFDRVLINDELQKALADAEAIIENVLQHD